MERFVLSNTTSIIGFQKHVVLDLIKPISSQLNRHRLYHRSSNDISDANAIKKIIEHNASLRIAFNWSFESTDHYEKVMKDCIQTVIPKYNIMSGNMCSDLRCDWLGFMPFNAFEKEAYKDLSIYNLILFNNELIDFQEEVVKFVSDHKIFRQHAIVRDERYRFNLYKSIRKNPKELYSKFLYYVESLKETSLPGNIPREFIEQGIGCHYLYHPEIFFELLEFSILKGDIRD